MLHVSLPRSIDPGAAMRLLKDLERAHADSNDGAIVLTGIDGVFCEGLDLEALTSGTIKRDGIADSLETFARGLRLLQRSRKPTIALVDGEARGGGLGLAAACDVVIASERSRFALPELLWGLLPAVIYPSLRQRLSLRQCRLWLMTGSARTAEEARESGLVDEVVPSAALERACAQWERRLSRARPESIVKLRAFLEEDLRDAEDGTRRGIAITSEALMDAGIREALRQFAEGGLPPWGR